MSDGLKTVLFITLATFAGCTHALHVNHTSDYNLEAPLSSYRIVKSQAEQFCFLGFVGNTEYVERAFNDLKRKCPKGKVVGIQTRYSSSHGFLSWTNILRMVGYCSTN